MSVFECDKDPELWFADAIEDRRRAARRCMGCPIIEACRAGAVERDEKFGVWGAVDFTGRRAA